MSRGPVRDSRISSYGGRCNGETPRYGGTNADAYRNRQPFKLTFLFQVHNIYLTVGSGILLLLMLEEM